MTTPAQRARLARYVAALWRPPPRLTVAEWAERYRYLAGEAAAEPGRYRVDRMPYQRAMMEDATDPTVHETVWQIGAQLGKTECINNIVGYFIDQRPSPILVVYPTLDSAKAWARDKFGAMVKASPRLRAIVREPKSRNSKNTTLAKTFPGGNLHAIGANSPSGLRQRSKRVVIQDEVDAFEMNAEGDPCELADRRAETYHDAALLKASTPTVKGESRIEALFLDSDQQRYFCPCPRCGHFQWLKWAQVKWTWTDKAGNEVSDPTRAVYVCEHCKAELSDAERISMVARGEWRATAPFKGRRGRHLSGLYRTIGKKRAFTSYLHEFVAAFLRAKAKGREALMVWVNTFLAETWEEEAEKIETSELMKRREAYDAHSVPAGALALTLAADVQADRLEAEVVAWGENDESWGLGYFILPGKPDNPETWRQLDILRGRTWTREDGAPLSISQTVVDTGAFTEDVLSYVKRRTSARVVGVKGANTAGSPLAAGPYRGNRKRAPVYRVGTDTAKASIMARLTVAEPGPGAMHFTNDPAAGYGEAYFSMLGAEEVRLKYVRGYPVRYWHKTRPRNEALDVRVYGMAALVILQPNFASLKKRLATQAAASKVAKQRPENPDQPEPAEGVEHPAPQKPRRARRPSGWIGKGWRT